MTDLLNDANSHFNGINVAADATLALLEQAHQQSCFQVVSQMQRRLKVLRLQQRGIQL